MTNTIKQIGLVALLGLSSFGCSNEGDAVSAAHSEGWRNVKIIESSYFLNFKYDRGEMGYQIVGENPRGDKASATVCCGYVNPLKGCTIRH